MPPEEKRKINMVYEYSVLNISDYIVSGSAMHACLWV